MSNSTSKMLSKMIGGTTSSKIVSANEAEAEIDAKLFDSPQLKLQPDAEMEHILKNSLGNAFSKNNTPMGD